MLQLTTYPRSEPRRSRCLWGTAGTVVSETSPSTVILSSSTQDSCKQGCIHRPLLLARQNNYLVLRQRKRLSNPWSWIFSLGPPSVQSVGTRSGQSHSVQRSWRSLQKCLLQVCRRHRASSRSTLICHCQSVGKRTHLFRSWTHLQLWAALALHRCIPVAWMPSE